MGTSGNDAVGILVVDRDPVLLDQVKRTLEVRGFRPETAASGARGLVLARGRMPALMIIGTELSDCSGFEFANSVCGEYPADEIPIIYMSTGHDPEAIAAARAAGGVYCLTKPVDELALLDLVDQALWMPHLVRRHLDIHTHSGAVKAPRVFARESVRVASHKHA